MRDKFNEELHLLNDELIVMGALCEEAIAAASKYLLEGDASLYTRVSETDIQIDRKERDIEALCLRLLLCQQPVAHDLRIVSSALKIISDMERIGDQAYDIAEIACRLITKKVHVETHIAQMARTVIKMLSDSIQSFVKKDVSLAETVTECDNIADSLFDCIKNELVSVIRSGSENAEAALDLLMVAKYFERIGDHAENIAEWVIFSITGSHPSI